MTTRKPKASPAQPTLAWHFLRADGCLQFPHNGNPSVKVRRGVTLRHKGELALCVSGLHASIRLIDALRYAPGAIICRVECGGEILCGDDKICAETRKVLWMFDATKLLHTFACDVAEEALLAECKAGREPDARSWKAIEVKRMWIDGKATDSELASARAAASARADAAGGGVGGVSARAAAYAAVSAYAASDAGGVGASARAAAYADAAYAYAAAAAAAYASADAAGAKQNERITGMVLTEAKRLGLEEK